MSPGSDAISGRSLSPWLIASLLAGLIIIMPLRTALEQYFIYFPEYRHLATPSAVGLNYEEIVFPAADDTTLSGWLIPGQPDAPLVLFCMGNAGNMSHRLTTMQLLHDLGVAVFVFNYRGYGTSTGRPSEAGTYDDIAGAIRLLHERGWKAGQIIIFGRSLGAAVGLEAALRTPPAGLIMESAFTSIAAMGRYHYPLLNLLLGWLVGAEYDNRGKISQLHCPLLLIHGSGDTICPPFMAEELYALAPMNKQLVWIPGAGHNDGMVLGGEAYRDAIRGAIARWTGFAAGQRQ